jgi:hypothetical protein
MINLDYGLAWHEEAEMARYAGYTDSSGIQHESYEAACIYYGADTPAQIEAEYAYYDQIAAIEHQDAMEAQGGPLYQFAGGYDVDDEIPF